MSSFPECRCGHVPTVRAPEMSSTIHGRGWSGRGKRPCMRRWTDLTLALAGHSLWTWTLLPSRLRDHFATSLRPGWENTYIVFRSNQSLIGIYVSGLSQVCHMSVIGWSQISVSSLSYLCTLYYSRSPKYLVLLITLSLKHYCRIGITILQQFFITSQKPEPNPWMLMMSLIRGKHSIC